MKSAAKYSSGFRLVILVEAALAVLALLLGWILRIPLMAQLGHSARSIRWAVLLGVVATLPLFALFLWLVHASWPRAKHLRQQVERLIRELFPHASIAQLMSVAVVAGVGEELLFRGAIQSLIVRWSTPIVGLAVASLIFGLFHAVSLLYFALATLVGAYFGCLVLALDDLVTPIVAHGLYDFLALAYLSRQLNELNIAASGIAATHTLEAEDERTGG